MPGLIAGDQTRKGPAGRYASSASVMPAGVGREAAAAPVRVVGGVAAVDRPAGAGSEAGPAGRASEASPRFIPRTHKHMTEGTDMGTAFRVDVSWVLESDAWRLTAAPGEPVQWHHCEWSELVEWRAVSAEAVPPVLRAVARAVVAAAASGCC